MTPSTHTKYTDRRMMTPRCVVILLFLFLLTGSCGRLDRVEYSDFRDIEAEGWDPLRYLEFFPWPVDSTRAAYASYDLILYVRYTGRCTLRQLPLLVESESLAGIGSEKPDTLHVNVELYTAGGNKKGKGPYTIYEVLDTLARDIRVTPGYTVTISNLLDAGSTQGVRSVGLILSRTGPQTNPFRILRHLYP